MNIRIYKNTCHIAYSHVLTTFAKGITSIAIKSLNNDKVKVVSGKTYTPSDLAVVMWSPRAVDGKDYTKFRKEVYEEQKAKGKKTIIIETAIIRTSRKHEYFRIGIDDVSNLGEFGNQNCPVTRWHKLKQDRNVKFRPWNKTGKKIMVVGQYPLDFSLGGINFNNWVTSTINTLQQHTNRVIEYRPHPVGKHLPQPNINIPLVKDSFNWNDFHATVSFSSGMAVDGIIRGIPAITTNKRSFAWDVSTHDLTNVENVVIPTREKWLSSIAYAQWTRREMRLGQAWRRLRPKILEHT